MVSPESYSIYKQSFGRISIMYEIIDVIHDYLFVTLRLRDVRTGATRDWQHWDDLEDWLCEEYGVKDLKGLVIDALPKHGGWVATEFNNL